MKFIHAQFIKKYITVLVWMRLHLKQMLYIVTC
jgi:hypothetical protein